MTSLRSSLKSHDATCVVLSALDDVAYLFNLRGSDIQYNPVFFAYAAVTETEVRYH